MCVKMRVDCAFFSAFFLLIFPLSFIVCLSVFFFSEFGFILGKVSGGGGTTASGLFYCR